MKQNLVTIGNTEIPVVGDKGQRVVTFAMIDQVHGRCERTARRNFDQNKDCFIESVDFYHIDSKGLDEFRASGIFGESAQNA